MQFLSNAGTLRQALFEAQIELAGGALQALAIELDDGERQQDSGRATEPPRLPDQRGHVETHRSLAAVPDPVRIRSHHAEAIGAGAEVGIDGFARADSDPLRSLAFLNTYQETITKLYSSMNDLQDYFTLENVPFQSSDPGYIFINKK